VLEFGSYAEAGNTVLLEFICLEISFQISFLWMSLDRLFYLLNNLDIKLAFPLRSVSLWFINHTIKHLLPLLVLKIIKPKLVL